MSWLSRLLNRDPKPAPPALQTPILSLEPPKPLPASAPGGRVVSLSTPLGEGATRHPGWGLGADTVRAAFVQAEAGLPALQNDTFEDIIERDGHLRHLYESRIDEVAGKDWILQAGGPDAADAEAAAQLEKALRLVPNVNEAWEHLLTAHFNGYAPLEIAWDRRDGLVVPVWFAPVPHRRIRFHRDTDEPRLLTKENTTDGEELAPGRWMFARRRHRKTVRAGLLRTATWLSWLKGLSVRDWQIFCSRFGLPFVLGTYPESANEEEIRVLTDAIKAFGSNGGAALKDGAKIEVKEIAVGGNNANVHPGLVSYANSEMSKLIAGGTLTSGEGSSTGSYALGTVHQANKFALALGDATKLGQWVASQLGAAFCRFNGLTARPPRLMHRVVPDLNPLERMKLLSIYCNELGGELDEDQVREENGIKAVTGKSLKGTKKPEPAPGQGGAPGGDSPPKQEDAA